ncbi:MAG TPA: DUF1501 domain-containing protein [Chthonomonadaceae bacterium]|nr:DUF1501 domain-containing protein [Chthonomonadaceae bacterium]
MLRLDAEKPVHLCDGMTRRDFLHAGALSMLGLTLTLPEFLAMKAEGAVRKDKDVNCIMLFLLGAPSQLDTWDMKPNAPAEIRGPFKPIKTNVPGIQISEIFPRMAKRADRFSIIRSVYHTAAAVHDTGHQMMQTGRLFTGGLEHPHIGCVLSYLKGARGDVPAHVLMPRPMGPTGGNLPHGQTAGYLGKAYDPFVLNADPSDKNFKVPDLLPPDYIDAIRAERRRKLREAVDGAVKAFETSQDARLMDSNFHQAYTLMSSAKAREAFEISKESEATRDKYGRNKFGQSCLLARRLVERGVRFVTINMFETVFDELTWDIHGSAPFTPIDAYRTLCGPWFDNGYTSLIEELQERGLYENTIVVAMGEFGRTPKINPAGGRDHWPQCWSMILGGGGIKGGQVIGASDEIGGYPTDRPTTPADVAATLFSALGISLTTELPSPGNRPLPVVEYAAKPITELL